MTAPDAARDEHDVQDELDEKLARRLQDEHAAWLNSPECERRQRAFDEHFERWKTSRPAALQAEADAHLALGEEDRRSFVAALDRRAPDILAAWLNAPEYRSDAPRSREFYDRKRREGKRHHQALIALARRRIDVLWAILRDRRPCVERPPLPACA